MAPAHLIRDRFVWNRQPIADWPRWLLSKNWATGPSGNLVVHVFETVLTFRPGEVIALLATSEIVRL